MVEIDKNKITNDFFFVTYQYHIYILQQIQRIKQYNAYTTSMHEKKLNWYCKVINSRELIN